PILMARSGPLRATERRLCLTARCLALRLRYAGTAAPSAPDGRSNGSLPMLLGIKGEDDQRWLPWKPAA
ncbi:MAG: hypothetical protein MJA83_13295, partial [Gammaproteobacteria bacterium]|nr:hypothetical protein [Gammaproteobacteria bacterium]